MLHDPAANCQAPSRIRRGALTPRGAVTYVRAARPLPDAGTGRTTSGRRGPVRRRTRCTARPRSVSGAGRSDSPGAVAARSADARLGIGCWRPPGAAGSARSTADRCGPGRRRTERTARPRGISDGPEAYRPAGAAVRRCGRFACAVRRQRIPDRSTRGRRCPAARRTWCTKCPAGATAADNRRSRRRLSRPTARAAYVTSGRRRRAVKTRTRSLAPRPKRSRVGRGSHGAALARLPVRARRILAAPRAQLRRGPLGVALPVGVRIDDLPAVPLGRGIQRGAATTDQAPRGGDAQ